jgi:hypothetical protein
MAASQAQVQDFIRSSLRFARMSAENKAQVEADFSAVYAEVRESRGSNVGNGSANGVSFSRMPDGFTLDQYLAALERVLSVLDGTYSGSRTLAQLG